MGMDQKVTFAPDKAPAWSALQAFFAAKNYPLQLRMIDGELAFPDETPPDAWRELRVGTPAGMITLRRDPDCITLVTWGNADAAMRQAWNALTWGVAHLSDGKVNGGMSADEYAKSAELPTFAA
jgi:hypothetical protein